MRIAAVITLLALVACSDAGADSPETTTPGSPTTSTSATDEPNDDQAGSSEPHYPESNMTDELLDAIVAHAAERTGVDQESVEVISITEEMFNDSSLGCPKPGEFYTQVITPGHIVIVRAGGTDLDYRVGTQPEHFKLCSS